MSGFFFLSLDPGPHSRTALSFPLPLGSVRVSEHSPQDQSRKLFDPFPCLPFQHVYVSVCLRESVGEHPQYVVMGVEGDARERVK